MTRILNEIRTRGELFSQVKERKDHFSIPIPPGEGYHSCRLTILDTLLGGEAHVSVKPPAGQIGNAELQVDWTCNGSGLVKYQVEAFSSPLPGSLLASPVPVTRQLTGFLPSLNGFPFDNRFEAIPSLKLIGDLRYGDASKGLCGGMVFAALDYFMAGLKIPPIPPQDLSEKTKSPLHGPVFDYIGKRLFSSFDVPAGVMKYLEFMHPHFPDFSARKGRLGLPPRSRAWSMIRREWPVIKEKLDLGQPCPLGLVLILSTDASRLGENHQVLAYGYDLVGDDLTLFIYDPNEHDRDDITLKLNIGDPERKTPVTYFENRTVPCFFMTNYTFSMPPGGADIPGRVILYEDEKFCGRSIDVVKEHANLVSLKEGNFNDCTSSIVILSGNWSFYKDPGYQKPFLVRNKPLVLGPGNYPRVADLGIQDNEITSLKSVPNLPTLLSPEG